MPAPSEEPIDLQRVLMDRARHDAERDGTRLERPLLPRLAGLGLALLAVAVVLFAFDRFLTSMQRFLSLPVVDPAPALTEPMPAFVVPEEPGAANEAGPADASPEAAAPPR